MPQWRRSHCTLISCFLLRLFCVRTHAAHSAHPYEASDLKADKLTRCYCVIGAALHLRYHAAIAWHGGICNDRMSCGAGLTGSLRAMMVKMPSAYSACRTRL